MNPTALATLLQSAQSRIMHDPAQAVAEFSAALSSADATPVQRVRLGRCLGLAGVEPRLWQLLVKLIHAG